MDDVAKAGRGRQAMAPETLRMAHVLNELDRGYFSGMNARFRRQESECQGKKGGYFRESETARVSQKDPRSLVWASF